MFFTRRDAWGSPTKKTLLYEERNDACRKLFLKTREAIPEAHRVYVDERGFDAPLVRPCGYSRKDEKVMGEHTGKRFPRTSVIAGLKENQVLAPMEFKGYCDTEVVLSWVKEMSLPQLKKGDRVI